MHIHRYQYRSSHKTAETAKRDKEWKKTRMRGVLVCKIYNTNTGSILILGRRIRTALRLTSVKGLQDNPGKVSWDFKHFLSHLVCYAWRAHRRGQTNASNSSVGVHLKGVWHEIFSSWFLSKNSFHLGRQVWGRHKIMADGDADLQ
jgi:hypothetical protein